MTVTVHQSPLLTAKAVALRMEMRKLWEDHITWTRLAIVSLTTDSPDTQATVGRLLQNRTDIGNAVKPFYGTAAGNELTPRIGHRTARRSSSPPVHHGFRAFEPFFGAAPVPPTAARCARSAP